MHKNNLSRLLFLTLSIFFLTSCQESEISFIDLENVQEKQLLFVHEENSFEGSVSSNITYIELFKNDTFIKKIIPEDDTFEFSMIFEETSPLTKLKLIGHGFDENDTLEIVAESIYSFHVIDRTFLDTDPIEDEPTYSDTEDDERFSINLKMNNFDSNDRLKGLSAKDLLERIFNSDEFKKRVINFRYNGASQFANNKDMTNEEIYTHLMSGQEVLNGQIDFEMDISVTLYRSSWFGRKTIGYTYPNKPMIYSNTRFFDHYSPSQVAGNWAHEWVHKMGFGHDKYSTAQRPYSVPYAIGYLIEEMAEEYLKNNFLLQ